MPYSPQATDIRGQLYAQTGQNVADTIKQGAQQYQQNKIMANQAIGQFEAAAKANPDILQFLEKEDGSVPDSVKAAYNSLKTGGTVPVQKAALLAQFGNTYATQKAATQDQQMRQLQIQQMQRQAAMMNSFMSQQGQGAGLQPQGQGGQQAAPPAGVSNFLPVGGPKPDLRSTFVNLAQSTGQMPDPKEATSQWRADVDGWNKRSQPVGYVMGGVTTDKDGNKVQDYYRVNRQNDGTVLQEKEPITNYAGNPPPGRLLNPDTFEPLPPQVQAQQAAAASGGAPATPPTKEQQAAVLEASNDLQTMQQKLVQLNKLQDLNDQMNKNRWSRTAPITGGSIGNAIEAVAGDDSGMKFDAAASGLYADLMSGVKNIRNQNEFKAVAGNIPKSDQTADTRGQLLGDMRSKLINTIGRTQRALQNLRGGALPSSAWDNATKTEALPVKPTVPQADASSQKFTEGKVYKDAAGNLARYTNGQWVPLNQ